MALKTPITELDFFRVKSQLKEYLRADPTDRFKDFDFEGSNMSVLLDVLAYNTYQNNFYTNMAISEMFLDTAQMENSVVSHAKELNYLPKSAVSAMATVNITITDNNNLSSTMVIPENTRFTTTHEGDRYNFYTNETYIARQNADGIFIADGIEIFEGEIVDEAFFVTGTRNSIRLLNQNIDTSSIKLFESFEEPLERIEYIYRNDIFGVESTDAVFYIEPSFDSTYEILFGNNRFGRTPAANEQIRVFYRLSSGIEANGACRFTTAFRNNITVITATNAIGGSEKETIEDTKFFAPRSIQIQERAVTERDYEVLLKQRFNEIRDISVYGGDELDPPRYGKVAISVNLDGGLSEAAARNYEEYLRDKTPVAIQPIFLPPEFLFITLSINLFYSPKQTSQSKSELEQAVRDVLTQYNITSLEKFGAVFEVSRASTLIDNSNASISSNTLDALPYILYSPEFEKNDNPKFNFGTSLASQGIFLQSNTTLSYNTFIRSSVFIYEGISAIFEDDGLGIINIINEARRNEGIFDIIRRNAGTVDYVNGIARLSDFRLDSYIGTGIKVSANTQEKNVSSPKGRVLALKDADITINVVEIR
jgi:hypothetical protein